MHRERLLKLADLLDGYRDGGGPVFDLGSWSISERRRGGFLWLQKNECHTAACAIGLACTSGAFASEGLRYRLLRGSDTICPVFGAADNWDAVEEFFGLTTKQASHLFDQDSYKCSVGEAAARSVAHRIRAMVKPRKRLKKKPLPESITSALNPAKVIERA